MKKREVAVVGGGAAGMMAAIAAAREGARVTIWEGNDRLGQKILSTGNGKCNLGNRKLDSEQYYGTEKAFVESGLECFGTEDTIDFFGGIGLMTKEKNGYLYPYCEQASAVLDVLRAEVSYLGIRVIPKQKVRAVHRNQRGGFTVAGEGRQESFDRVILACGGKAAPKTGSDGIGFELAKSLGHRIAPVVPALTPLKCREEFFKSIAGVRAEAMITILDEEGGAVASQRGELQLTDYGISGIPVFQLSRTAGYIVLKQKQVRVRVDFLPDFSEKELRVLFEKRLISQSDRNVEEFFTGILNKKLMLLFEKLSGIKGSDPVREVPEKKLWRVMEYCKSFIVTVVGTGGFQNAQVTAGGVRTREIGPDMQSKLVPGLFFAGEIMDVDGKCGGYNLQWAWTSGYLAGRAAAK